MSQVEKKHTITDVANLAGVSIKTVSRVINKEPNVRPATQLKVSEAIKSLNYRPSASARRLAGNRSYILGLLYDNPSASYVTKVQNGLIASCREQHYDLLIHPCDYTSPDLDNEVTELVRNTRVDGLILTPPLSDIKSLRKRLAQLSVGVACLSPADLPDSSLCVQTNDREACAAMVHHLASLGHRKIGFILGHPDHNAIALRYEGYLQGMQELGIDVPKQWCVQGYNSFESGVDCARELLGGEDKPTAIFASNDDMAAGVIKTAHELGIRVPDQLSVTGFDDIPLAGQLWPSLTTVRQPMKEMAQLVGDLLIRQLRGEDIDEIDAMVPSEPVIRDSTGPVGS